MRTSTTSGLSRSTGHRVLRAVLVGVETLIALAAVYGGVGLMNGNSIKMKDEWLAQTPFGSWFWPGVFLILVVSVPMVVAVVAELTGRGWAYAASVLAGAAQIGWIAVQWAVMQRYFFLQPVMMTAGALVVLLAWLLHQGEPLWRR